MSIARFGVNKPVVVNLLMLTLLIGGIVMGLALRREMFPETTPEQALITMPYPGASPEEVETSLALKVEDALADLDEVEEIRSTLAEGGGGVTVEFREGVDPDAALDEVERAIDALQDLPRDAEEIEVELFEPRLPVIRLALFGDLDERTMKRGIRALRDELRRLPGMGEITIDGVRDYEVRVDVPQAAMLEHGLSITDISERIGAWMQDVPGGTVQGSSGNVKVRTLGVEERAAQIEQIPLRADTEGRVVRVGDVAQVREGFVDEQIVNRFNGQPAAVMTVFKVGDQDIVSMAHMVRAYVDARNGEPFSDGMLAEWVASGRIDLLRNVLPDGPVDMLENVLTNDALRAYQLGQDSNVPLPDAASLQTMSNLARFVEGRLDLLIRNASYGAMLVFATLLLFLNWRVATWVGIGLATALFGTVLVMWALDITLNLLTTFGLIVVLGLLVDDAIVVAENVQARHDRGEPALEAAVTGTEQVQWPVVATVLTSIVAFLPLTFIRGQIGDLLGALPAVVACALGMSLVEALLILPSHMGHTLRKRDQSHPTQVISRVRRIERFRDHLVLDRLVPAYAWLLRILLRHRYVTVAGIAAVWMISLGVVLGGHLTFNFLPGEDAETIVVDVRMPIGTPIEQTQRIAERIERAASAQPESRGVATVVGQRSNIESGQAEAASPHLAQMFIELQNIEQRERTSMEVIAAIRDELEGELTGIDRLSFTEITGGPGGPDISIELRGRDVDELQRAANDLKRQLVGFEGVHDIADDNDLGQLELQVALTPAGAAQGFTREMVATQLRGYVFGLDAHTYAAEEEDIDVRVRADEPTRRSLHRVQHAWVVNPAGQFVPLSEIATVQQSTGYSTITRIDRQRAVTVTADTAPGVSPETIAPRLDLDQIERDHPTVTVAPAGRQERLAEAFASLPWGMLAALAMIYVILAWLFGSYVQPIVVMLVIPFATIGVVWGHVLMGFDLTFLSIIGFVALSGIVVNDSLILIDFYNAERAQGRDIVEGLIQAGRARLRPILLTTITTVSGLLPLMLEQSFQARFLIPMAIAVAFGLLAATVLILIMLPCAMLIFDDVRRGTYFLWHGEPRGAEGAPAVQ
ncbi:MAG: efflux RND transporter permease subunit [Phycisphaeraceae bacterium]